MNQDNQGQNNELEVQNHLVKNENDNAGLPEIPVGAPLKQDED